jgi:predicted metal-dependent hydrolase
MLLESNSAITMAKIRHGTKQIEYIVKPSKRSRTAAITVTAEAKVVVRVPRFLDKSEVAKIVRKKAPWIIREQEYFKDLSLRYPEKEFVSGEQLLYLGRRYRLKVKNANDSDAGGFRVSGRRMIANIDSRLNDRDNRDRIKKIIIEWYRMSAQKVITKRIKQYRKILRVKTGKIEIKDQKKRWGSCSRNGILRFNWRVVIAPMSIIDYIVVHELCHLKIKNHSREFWKLVSLILPDYQRRREWLRNNVGIFRV